MALFGSCAGGPDGKHQVISIVGTSLESFQWVTFFFRGKFPRFRGKRFLRFSPLFPRFQFSPVFFPGWRAGRRKGQRKKEKGRNGRGKRKGAREGERERKGRGRKAELCHKLKENPENTIRYFGENPQNRGKQPGKTFPRLKSNFPRSTGESEMKKKVCPAAVFFLLRIS